MIAINTKLTPTDLAVAITRMWEASAPKIISIEESVGPTDGSPVFTVKGAYTAKGWTEWTQGFQFGSAILQYDATGDKEFLAIGRENTRSRMAPHVTHMGVHDHGFNNVSTYGNLRRLMNEGRIPENRGERDFYELALKSSGAVQARRWAETADGSGYIYSFNGPHSLFADTIRSLRALAVSHSLGHVLMEEKDRKVSLLDRLIQHALTTSRYVVYYGEGRDAYDMRGRVVHEAIFNRNDGSFRCPSSQQGFSPFTTWTRGLAWVMTGYAEQLEFLSTRDDSEIGEFMPNAQVMAFFEKAARASCDFYIDNCPTDGVPYWDTGAPELHKLGDCLSVPSDPFNEYEPVDSSAAAIAAQGLVRLGNYLTETGSSTDGARYRQAGFTVLDTLLNDTYLSTDPSHQGLLLHSVYHRPNGWDYIPEGRNVPCGESSMWGDYHLREAALLVQRMAEGKPYYRFFG